MTYVITQSCCNDASCVEVCPVDCIHPTPDEPDFGKAEMLYIHPSDCIDCGACVDACPVGAIYPDFELPEHLNDYLAVNADYYQFAGEEYAPSSRPAAGAKIDAEGPLRVAVVGAGPSGWFVADELIKTRRTPVEVTVIDRLATPEGLIRYGVAPDHLNTKAAAEVLTKVANRKETHVRLGLEVGRDLSHQEILDAHHAVVFATGTPAGRTLSLPGEELPGSISAAEFVGWYNGHPDHADHNPDLSHARAVVIGNGNVALDMARLMLMPEDRLHRSEVAPHALEGLTASSIDEVVVIARRGAPFAAFTSPEFRALVADPDIAVVIDAADAAEMQAAAAAAEPGAAGFALLQKAALMSEVAGAPQSGTKRLVFRFNAPPARIVGDDRATGVELDSGEVIEAGLVLRATGYRTDGVIGVSADTDAGKFRHHEGRVLERGTDQPAAGLYTAGWAKRGPSGVIGTNRWCAAETVRSILDDYAAGLLKAPAGGLEQLDELLSSRSLPKIEFNGWKALDEWERSAGTESGRPRVKVVTASEQLRIAQGL